MSHRYSLPSSPKLRRMTAMALVLLTLVAASPVLAQTFIEPTNPLGGPTAAPLNTSDTVQRKLGSLIIGNAGGNSRLCLNAGSVSADPNFCIAAWTDLTSITGQYVKLYIDDWNAAGGTPSGGSVLGPEPSQNGYARVKAAAANNQLYSIIAEASTLANSAAVYATDSNNANSWAGYFSGKVMVGNLAGADFTACINDASPDTNPLTKCKKLCLNGTDNDISDGKGCIASWTGVSNQLSDTYVLLQSAPGPLTMQTGGESLTGTGVFGTNAAAPGGIVLGLPPAGTSLCQTCGDGICSSGETGGVGGNCRAGFAVTGCLNVPNPPGGDCP